MWQGGKQMGLTCFFSPEPVSWNITSGYDVLSHSAKTEVETFRLGNLKSGDRPRSP